MQPTSPPSPTPPPPTSNLHLPPSCSPPSASNPAKPLVWIVFGATGHLGQSLTKRILAASSQDNVTAVGKTGENTLESMSGWSSRCEGMLCDVRVRETVQRVIDRSVERWGRIDVIANCSGYGVIGSCEDQSLPEIRNQFRTNFLGTLYMIQLSLPLFRRQQSGRYLIYSSTSGALGVPGLGPYCATKYATEALIESLLYEIDHFRIRATLVEPGLVRRDDHSATLDDTSGHPGPANTTPAAASAPPPEPRPSTTLPALPPFGHFLLLPPSAPYASPTSPSGHARRMISFLGTSRQPTSAVKCAELVWQLGHCAYPPLRLLLGSYAVESVRDRLRCVIEEIEDWKHLSFPVEGEGERRESGSGMDVDVDGEGEGQDDGEGEEEVEMDGEQE
ncbi:MAG: hypothetical protein M1824_006235 [Vezdaea acicularis]|nr:MAG: hypothetical protein M1824_006235 [Vezdaea acicularis]